MFAYESLGRLQVRVKWLTHKASIGAVPENLSEVVTLRKSNTLALELQCFPIG